MSDALFSPGQVVATPGVLEVLEAVGVEPLELLRRHLTGDFGECGKYADIKPTMTPEEMERGALATADDGKLNVWGIATGDGRILSAYVLDSARVWIITEWDRSVTTLLLPDEY